MEKSDKLRILSHFFPRHETSVILYLVLTSQRCGSVEKSDKLRSSSGQCRANSKLCCDTSLSLHTWCSTIVKLFPNLVVTLSFKHVFIFLELIHEFKRIFIA